MCGDIDGDGGANYDPDEGGNDNEYWTLHWKFIIMMKTQLVWIIMSELWVTIFLIQK